MTLIFAHRGFSAQYPENTMLAFQKALEAGADGIELDVHLSEDGHVVVIHDRTVDRTTNGTGLVKDFNLFELQELHKPQKVLQKELEKIPSLEEVLEWLVATKLYLNIELKNKQFQYPQLEEKVIALVRQFGLEKRTTFSSFNHYSLAKCQQIDSEIEVAPLYEADLYEPWNYGRSFGATALHPGLQFAHKEIIEQAHREGIAVRPWLVNQKKDMLFFFEIDCVAILTDEVEKAVQTRNRFRQLYRRSEEKTSPVVSPPKPVQQIKKPLIATKMKAKTSLDSDASFRQETKQIKEQIEVSQTSRNSSLSSSRLQEHRIDGLPRFDHSMPKEKPTIEKTLPLPDSHKQLTENQVRPKKQKRAIPDWLGHPEAVQMRGGSSSSHGKEQKMPLGQTPIKQPAFSRANRKKK